MCRSDGGLVLFIILCEIATMVSRVEGDEGHLYRTNHSLSNLIQDNSSSSVLDQIDIKEALHVAITELNSLNEPVSAAESVCEVSNHTLRFRQLSLLRFAARIISMPYNHNDYVYLIKNDPSLLIMTFEDQRLRTANELLIPNIGAEVTTASLTRDNTTLVLLFDSSYLAFVNITNSAEPTVQQEDIVKLPFRLKTYDLVYYKKHIFLAVGDKGVSIIDASDKEDLKFLFTLESTDFTTIAPINITRVWQNKGILFAIDHRDSHTNTFMLNISTISLGYVQQLNGESTLTGLEAKSYYTRPSGELVLQASGRNYVLELVDQTAYEEHHPRLDLVVYRIHTYGDQSIQFMDGTGLSIVGTTDQQAFYTSISPDAPSASVPYGQLSFKGKKFPLEDMKMVFSSVKDPSVLCLGSNQDIIVLERRLGTPRIECSAVLNDSYRFVIVQVIRANCSQKAAANDSDPMALCLDVFKFLIAKSGAELPKNYSFPQLPAPVVKLPMPLPSPLQKDRYRKYQYRSTVLTGPLPTVKTNTNIILYAIVVAISILVCIVAFGSRFRKKLKYKLKDEADVELSAITVQSKVFVAQDEEDTVEFRKSAGTSQTESNSF